MNTSKTAAEPRAEWKPPLCTLFHSESRAEGEHARWIELTHLRERVRKVPADQLPSGEVKRVLRAIDREVMRSLSMMHNREPWTPFPWETDADLDMMRRLRMAEHEMRKPS